MNIVYKFPSSDYGPWTSTVINWLKDNIGPCVENIEGGHLVLSDMEFDDLLYRLLGVQFSSDMARNGMYRPKIFRGEGWSMARLITKVDMAKNRRLPPGVLSLGVQCWFHFAFDNDAQGIQFKLTLL